MLGAKYVGRVVDGQRYVWRINSSGVAVQLPKLWHHDLWDGKWRWDCATSQRLPLGLSLLLASGLTLGLASLVVDEFATEALADLGDEWELPEVRIHRWVSDKALLDLGIRR